MLNQVFPEADILWNDIYDIIVGDDYFQLAESKTAEGVSNGKCSNDGDEESANISGNYSSLSDLMSPEEAERYKAYFTKDAPDMVMI